MKLWKSVWLSAVKMLSFCNSRSFSSSPPNARKRQVVCSKRAATPALQKRGCDAVSSSCFRSFRRNLNGSIRSRRKDCILTPKILRKRPTIKYTTLPLLVSCCIKHIIKRGRKESTHSKPIPLTKKSRRKIVSKKSSIHWRKRLPVSHLLHYALLY